MARTLLTLQLTFNYFKPLKKLKLKTIVIFYEKSHENDEQFFA